MRPSKPKKEFENSHPPSIEDPPAPAESSILPALAKYSPFQLIEKMTMLMEAEHLLNRLQQPNPPPANI
jgi:hypothetical protein